MKALRADLLQPEAAVHQTRSPGRGASQLLGLHALAGEVALAVDDGLRLARGPARERDEARVQRGERGRRRRRGVGPPRDARHPDRRPRPAGVAQHIRVAPVADDERRRAGLEPHAQVLRAQLLVAGQHDIALPKAGDHRRDPVGLVADERQDDVAAAHAALVHVRGQRSRGPHHLAERPFAARAVARELDEREAIGWRRFHDVDGEVGHRRAQSRTGKLSRESTARS